VAEILDTKDKLILFRSRKHVMLKSLQGKKINWKRIISFLYKARVTSGLKSLQGNISSHEGLNIRKTAS